MKPSILLIEDNEQNRYLVTFLLEKSGYAVHHAPDGVRALALARELKPRIVLLDIQLPTMDGYAVCRALREIEGLADSTIIAVTSFAMPGDREKALSAGCSGYIEKPIDPATFVAEIQRLSAR